MNFDFISETIPVNVLISNILGIIIFCLLIISGIMKTKASTLIAQGIMTIVSATSNILVGGISGAIMNLLSTFRNVLYYKDLMDKKFKIILSLLSIILPVIFGDLSLLSILPVANSIMCIWLMSTNDIIKLKIVIALSGMLWCIYDLSLKIYTSATFDFIVVLITLLSAYKINKKRSEKIIETTQHSDGRT